jgi:hypothetical protein
MTLDLDRPMTRNFALPVLILATAIVISLLGGTIQLLQDRGAISAASDAQSRATPEGDHIRRQLDALLAGAASLARLGNASANAALQTLARQGVNYTPPK